MRIIIPYIKDTITDIKTNFFWLSFIILLDFFINSTEQKEKPFSFYFFFINEDNLTFGIIGIAIHVVLLIGILVYISIETYIVIKFMKENFPNLDYRIEDKEDGKILYKSYEDLQTKADIKREQARLRKQRQRAREREAKKKATE